MVICGWAGTETEIRIVYLRHSERKTKAVPFLTNLFSFLEFRPISCLMCIVTSTGLQQILHTVRLLILYLGNLCQCKNLWAMLPCLCNRRVMPDKSIDQFCLIMETKQIFFYAASLMKYFCARRNSIHCFSLPVSVNSHQVTRKTVLDIHCSQIIPSKNVAVAAIVFICKFQIFTYKNKSFHIQAKTTSIHRGCCKGKQFMCYFRNTRINDV